MSNDPKPQLFQKMLEVANAKVKAYQSDLYHDAKSLDQCRGDFVWIVRESGTHFISDPGAESSKNHAKAIVEASGKDACTFFRGNAFSSDLTPISGVEDFPEKKPRSYLERIEITERAIKYAEECFLTNDNTSYLGIGYETFANSALNTTSTFLLELQDRHMKARQSPDYWANPESLDATEIAVSASKATEERAGRHPWQRALSSSLISACDSLDMEENKAVIANAERLIEARSMVFDKRNALEDHFANHPEDQKPLELRTENARPAV